MSNILKTKTIAQVQSELATHWSAIRKLTSDSSSQNIIDALGGTTKLGNVETLKKLADNGLPTKDIGDCTDNADRNGFIYVQHNNYTDSAITQGNAFTILYITKDGKTWNGKLRSEAIVIGINNNNEFTVINSITQYDYINVLGTFNNWNDANVFINKLDKDKYGRFIIYVDGNELLLTITKINSTKSCMTLEGGSFAIGSNITSLNDGTNITIYRFNKTNPTDELKWGIWSTIDSWVQNDKNGDAKYNHIYSNGADNSSKCVITSNFWFYTHNTGEIFLRFKRWGQDDEHVNIIDDINAQNGFSQQKVPEAWSGATGLLRADIYRRLDMFNLSEQGSTTEYVNISVPIFTIDGSRNFTISKATSAKAGVMTAQQYDIVNNFTNGVINKDNAGHFITSTGKNVIETLSDVVGEEKSLDDFNNATTSKPSNFSNIINLYKTKGAYGQDSSKYMLWFGFELHSTQGNTLYKYNFNEIAGFEPTLSSNNPSLYCLTNPGLYDVHVSAVDNNYVFNEMTNSPYIYSVKERNNLINFNNSMLESIGAFSDDVDVLKLTKADKTNADSTKDGLMSKESYRHIWGDLKQYDIATETRDGIMSSSYVTDISTHGTDISNLKTRINTLENKTVTKIDGIDLRDNTVQPYVGENQFFGLGNVTLVSPTNKNNLSQTLGEQGYSASVLISPWNDKTGGNQYKLGFGNGQIAISYGKENWSNWDILASQSYVTNAINLIPTITPATETDNGLMTTTYVQSLHTLENNTSFIKGIVNFSDIDTLSNSSHNGIYYVRVNKRTQGILTVTQCDMSINLLQSLYGPFYIDSTGVATPTKGHAGEPFTIIHRSYDNANNKWYSWKYIQTSFLRSSDYDGHYGDLNGDDWTWGHSVLNYIIKDTIKLENNNIKKTKYIENKNKNILVRTFNGDSSVLDEVGIEYFNSAQELNYTYTTPINIYKTKGIYGFNSNQDVIWFGNKNTDGTYIKYDFESVAGVSSKEIYSFMYFGSSDPGASTAMPLHILTDNGLYGISYVKNLGIHNKGKLIDSSINVNFTLSDKLKLDSLEIKAANVSEQNQKIFDSIASSEQKINSQYEKIDEAQSTLNTISLNLDSSNDKLKLIQSNLGKVTQQTNLITNRLTGIDSTSSGLKNKFSILNRDYIALKDNYGTLNGNFSRLSTTYNTLDNNYTGLKSRLDTADSTATLLGSKCTTLGENIKSCNKNISTAQERLETLKSTFESTYNKLDSNYNGLNSKLLSIDSTSKALNTHYDTLKGNYNLLSGKLTEAGKSLTNLRDTFNTTYNTLDSNYGSIKSRLELVDSTSKALKLNYNELNGQISTLKTTYNTLDGNYNLLSGKLTEAGKSLKESKDNMNNAVTYWQNRIKTAQDDLLKQYNDTGTNLNNLYIGLNNKVDGINEWKGNINTWQSGVNSSISGINSWKGNLTTWQSDINKWKSTSDTSFDDINSWKSGINTWKSGINNNISTFSSRFDIVDSSINTTQSDLDTTKNKLSTLQTAYNHLFNDYTKLYNRTKRLIGDNTTAQNMLYKMAHKTEKPKTVHTGTSKPLAQSNILFVCTQTPTDKPVLNVMEGTWLSRDYTSSVRPFLQVMIYDLDDNCIYETIGGSYSNDFLSFDLTSYNNDPKGNGFLGYCYIGAGISMNISDVRNNKNYAGKIYVSYCTNKMIEDDVVNRMKYDWSTDNTPIFELGNYLIKGNGGFAYDDKQYNFVLGSKLYVEGNVPLPTVAAATYTNIYQNLAYYKLKEATLSNANNQFVSLDTKYMCEPDEIIYRGCSMTKYKIFVPKNSISYLTADFEMSGMNKVDVKKFMSDETIDKWGQIINK